MSNIISNATSRSQANYGRFQPRADQRQFGVIYASLDGGATGFHHVEEVKTDGVPIGHKGGALRYDEFRDANGNTHDITLPNGQKVREMVCPIADVREKERREAAESTEMVNNYEKIKGVADRISDDGRVHLSSQIIERTTAETFTPHDEDTKQRLTVAFQQRATEAAPKGGGWTPERRAAQSAKMAQRHAAKSQPATT